MKEVGEILSGLYHGLYCLWLLMSLSLLFLLFVAFGLPLLKRLMNTAGLWIWPGLKQPWVQRKLNRLDTVCWIGEQLEYATPERFRELRKQRRIHPNTWIVIRQIAYCCKQNDRRTIAIASSGHLKGAKKWRKRGWKTELEKNSERSWLTDIHRLSESYCLVRRSDIERVLGIASTFQCWYEFHHNRLCIEKTFGPTGIKEENGC